MEKFQYPDPLLDRVLVEIAEKKEQVLSSGLILPAGDVGSSMGIDNSTIAFMDGRKGEMGGTSEPTEGIVRAIGPGKFDNNGKRVPMSLKVGDIVIFEKYAGEAIKVEGADPKRKFKLLWEGKEVGAKKGHVDE